MVCSSVNKESFGGYFHHHAAVSINPGVRECRGSQPDKAIPKSTTCYQRPGSMGWYIPSRTAFYFEGAFILVRFISARSQANFTGLLDSDILAVDCLPLAVPLTKKSVLRCGLGISQLIRIGSGARSTGCNSALNLKGSQCFLSFGHVYLRRYLMGTRRLSSSNQF